MNYVIPVFMSGLSIKTVVILLILTVILFVILYTMWFPNIINYLLLAIAFIIIAYLVISFLRKKK